MDFGHLRCVEALADLLLLNFIAVSNRLVTTEYHLLITGNHTKS
jgi:hypothetical protein